MWEFLEDISADIDAMLDGFRLQGVRRYLHQVYWWDETEIAVKADRIEPGLKLENMAAHSWHVADLVLLSGRPLRWAKFRPNAALGNPAR